MFHNDMEQRFRRGMKFAFGAIQKMKVMLDLQAKAD